MNKALFFVNSKKYKWEDTAMERFVKQNTNNSNASFYPKGELVISKGHLNGSNLMKLSWKFTISSMEPNNEQMIYVDAINGDILGNVPLIYDNNTTCTAQTRYSTIQNITGDSYSSGYRLFETRSTTPGNNVNIHTWNCLTQPNYTNAVEFSNTNTNWTSGSWLYINQDQVALDAHWGEEKILDYWSNVHVRNSIDNLGIPITGFVHFFQANTSAGWPNNAQWDGNSHVMRYGDGDGSIYNPLTALDVVAHEMGHGINQFTANLHSSATNEECDALNEGFSDIWGACVEHWAAPNKQTWLMGEELFNNGIFSCVRNLQNPKSLTASEGQHPDTYHGNFWSNVGEPHFNSTVLSHWFYLLSMGSGGLKTNDLGNSYNLSGIGIEIAQQIAYKTESVYLYSSADYTAARNATIAASSFIYGATSYQTAAVTNAWYAVGVGSQYQYTFSSSSPICTQSTYTVKSLVPGDSVKWSVTPANIVSFQQNNNSVTLTKLGNGVITLTATINSNQTISMHVSVGTPYYLGISGISNLNMVDANDFQVLPGKSNYAYEGVLSLSDGVGLATSYTWSLSHSTAGKPVFWWPNGSSVDVAMKTINTELILLCTASNSCGSYTTYYLFSTGTILPLSLKPNPSSTQVEVSIGDEATSTVGTFQPITSEISDNISYSISMVDSYGYTVYSTTKTSKIFTISTSTFRNGIYAVIVSDGKNVYQKKLIVNH